MKTNAVKKEEVVVSIRRNRKNEDGNPSVSGPFP